MAMICVSGARECDGCGRCFPGSPIYTCPACGEELDAISSVYLHEGEIVGCEYCIRTRQLYTVMEERG